MAEHEDTKVHLVRLIQNNRFLYDKLHPDYLNDVLKEQTWNAISVRCNMDVERCKYLWVRLSTPYLAALKVIYETNYVPPSRIRNRPHLKFLDEHMENFIHQPVNQMLIDRIILEVRYEMETDRTADIYGLPAYFTTNIRQFKLCKWCVLTTYLNMHPTRVTLIRNAIDKIVTDVMERVKPEKERWEALVFGLIHGSNNN